MRRLSLALAILALAILSCAVPVGNQLPTRGVPTATPLAISTATAAELPTDQTAIANAWTAKVKLPMVNVREKPEGRVIDTVTVGNMVTILSCVGNWCQIEKPAGYIWRGCLSDNPQKLGCTAK